MLRQTSLKRGPPFGYVLSLEKSQHGRPRKELDRERCTGPKVSQRAVKWEDGMGARRWWGRKSFRSQCPDVQRAIGSVWSQERPITQSRSKPGCWLAAERGKKKLFVRGDCRKQWQERRGETTGTYTSVFSPSPWHMTWDRHPGTFAKASGKSTG